MEVLKVVLVAILLMAFIFAALAVKLLIKKDGKFVNTHIGGNKHLKERGISCAQTYDKIEQAKTKVNVNGTGINTNSNDTITYC